VAGGTVGGIVFAVLFFAAMATLRLRRGCNFPNITCMPKEHP
jgi:hypothetical protein